VNEDVVCSENKTVEGVVVAAELEGGKIDVMLILEVLTCFLITRKQKLSKEGISVNVVAFVVAVF